MYKNVTLEMSLKPFKRTDTDYIREICSQFFKQWYALIKNCETVSVMLWASDGSEILDYDGNYDTPFEWSYLIGTANCELNTTGDDSISLHQLSQLYTENPPVMTYRILKKIVTVIKEEGKKVLPNTKIRVGHTFDIGPEFAKSDFKYTRHPEICSGQKLDNHGFVDCTATLHADNRYYAAYPNGIPEGTPIGLFLGRQSNVFLKDMDMDYIWLSNGFGFSADPWSFKGKVFDGETFRADKLTETREKVMQFWHLFREGCPDFPVEVRGTNNSVGIDYAADAVPLYDIYNSDLGITPPPNSPWAALNADYGLEIMGHMTRVCELPGEGFMFRYYIHDPWWVNSPWYDRYEGEPTDIYLPMAVSRIKEDGKVETADTLNILTIDNSYGNMPDSCVNEPLPHLIKAKKDAGDKPAPLVWVYPMREYTTSYDEIVVREMYAGDKYIKKAINNSFPLNCVVSTDIFLKNDLNIYNESILISPIPENEGVLSKLKAFIEDGGRVIFYGTEERLADIKGLGVPTVSTSDEPGAIREALKNYGYFIDVERIAELNKTPILTVARSNNAYHFSVFCENSTDTLKLQFPLGAPLLTGCDAEIHGKTASYRFTRFAHKSCRFFVTQKEGIVSAKEFAPVNGMYRRKMLLSGLKDATVCFFPEEYCKEQCIAGHFTWADQTPSPDVKMEVIKDKVNGTYYKAEHVSGDVFFYMPQEKYIK